MKKIYHLSNCKTCQKYIAALGEGAGFELQDIKESPISAEELDLMKDRIGSYEALFSRRARKYRSMGLHEQTLSEEDYRRLILEEYTFLKRPVTVIGNQVWAGSTKKNLKEVQEAL